MTNTEGTVAKRRVEVAFLQCFDATVFAEPVMMTDAEEQRLHTLLALLQDFGLILQPNVSARQECHDFDALLAHLRASVDAPIVDAAPPTRPPLT
jgi:hypothetical protein